MVGLPRILTVDPSGVMARGVRSILEMTARAAIQIDVPSIHDALPETERGCQLIVAAYTLDDQYTGLDFAAHMETAHPHIPVVVVADHDAPQSAPHGVRTDANFLYLHRSVEAHQFMQVLLAAIEERPIANALHTPSTASPSQTNDLGAVPHLDVRAAQSIIDSLDNDIGAPSLILATRTGDILIHRGVTTGADAETLVHAVLPIAIVNINASHSIGNRPSALTLLDGEEHDLFVLSVGFHHLLVIVFDGQTGARQLGAVNRYGRRAVGDLLIILGTEAFALREVSQTVSAPQAYPTEEETADESEDDALLERSMNFEDVQPVSEPEPLRLDPIEDEHLSLFDPSQLNGLDTDAVDDLFDPDTLAQIANETRHEKGPLSYNEARELGIIP